MQLVFPFGINQKSCDGRGVACCDDYCYYTYSNSETVGEHMPGITYQSNTIGKEATNELKNHYYRCDG